MVQVVVLLFEHHLEVMQRGIVRPQFAGERRFLRRDREQEQMVERQQRPDKHWNADQQQLSLGADGAERRQFHFANRFIMKNTSGSTNGNAHTIAAIDMSTWSSRR